MRMQRFAIAATLILSATPFAFAADKAPESKELPVVFEDSFDKGFEKWEPTDPVAWKIIEEDGNKILSQFQVSKYEPTVRSPKNIAWVKDLNVSDFQIDVKLRQTGKEYGHRDMCVFFGKQDASHFYYVHMATKADEHANSIFLVNGEPRVSIAKERTDGTNWSSGFHHIRITRNVESGEIAVYFNDMEKPIMKTVDKTFVTGTVGIGSFDDTGDIDDFTVRGTLVK